MPPPRAPGSARARAQPALLGALGTGRPEARVDEDAASSSRSSAPRSRSARARPPIRWATSRSTATAASSPPATASTSSTCSTSPRSRPSRRGRRSGDGEAAYAPPHAHDRRHLELTVNGRRATLAPLRHGSPSRRTGGLRTTRLEIVFAAARVCRAEHGCLSRQQLRRPDRLAGDRRPRRRTAPTSSPPALPAKPSATSSRVPEGPAPEPTRRARPRPPIDPGPARARRPRLLARQGARAARRESAVADGGFASLIAQRPPERRLRPRSRC